MIVVVFEPYSVILVLVTLIQLKAKVILRQLRGVEVVNFE